MPPVQTLAQRHIIRSTFRVRHIAEAKLVTRVYVSVCLSLAAFPRYCTDPDVTWETVEGALQLCTIGRICNRCTGFVDMTT